MEKWGYDVLAAADGNEAWALLQADDPPRMAIFDWIMPGKDGLELCQCVRKTKASRYTYVILLTACDRIEDVVRGLDAGADDNVTKPFEPSELHARLRAGRRILALQEALLSARDALRFQSTIDPLTGVWNRAASIANLRRELARSEREGTSLSVFMADIDHLRLVNDTYGHVAGDAVLRETAQRVRSATRLYDSVGRYDGEEFLVIAPGCLAAEAERRAERLRAAVGGAPFDLPEGPIQLTLSASALTTTELRGLSPALIITALNAALLRAKTGGCDRLEIATLGDLSASLEGEGKAA